MTPYRKSSSVWAWCRSPKKLHRPHRGDHFPKFYDSRVDGKRQCAIRRTKTLCRRRHRRLSQAAIEAAEWAVDEAVSREVPLRLVEVIPEQVEPAPLASVGNVRMEVECAGRPR